jgi:23S rRNA (cytidine1920-2'-O)/16S rRNA (cytidine1409-2'-O)-methyltransferase
MMKKIPVWELLIEKGYFDHRKTAESWVLAGKVIANNKRIDKPGQMVLITDEILVKGVHQKYVSKGGLKLEGALSDFNIDVSGIVAIDAGASTGGFTDCLIQNCAEKVYAVDVGYGQLAGKLNVNPRVVSMEKVNIGDVVSRTLNPKPTLATVDLSYLSLKKSIPIFAAILGKKGDLICLVKPLFEVKDSSMRRSGEIDNPEVFKELLKELADYVDELGYKVTGITYSHVTGNKGTREFFMRVSLDESTYKDILLSENEIAEQIDSAVRSVMEVELFKKTMNGA